MSAVLVQACIMFGFMHRLLVPYIQLLMLQEKKKKAHIELCYRVFQKRGCQLHFCCVAADGTRYDPATLMCVFQQKKHEQLQFANMLEFHTVDPGLPHSPKEAKMRAMLRSEFRSMQRNEEKFFSSIYKASGKFRDILKAVGVTRVPKDGFVPVSPPPPEKKSQVIELD